ncbi:pentatricopeptide repeat-containing protein At4g38010 [Dendrobium catenatum]|uniref:Pentatricopeptide repeat-containing protein n=1 Tax=Dendrobium catenatum TaxID=906689 RepID=A0A2I0X8Q1_9ASPA|nr:pentatricopeptide repeat-containing protein At4g38010 [Dendrobium catenatum]PKU84293.1 Pentatricopeptide repeat-containing protein [Dendrobium catenatum]
MTRASSPLKTILVTLLQEPLKIQFFAQVHCLLLTSGVTQDFSVLLMLAEFLASSQSPSSAYFTLKQTLRFPNPFIFNSLITVFTQTSSPQSAFVVYKYLVCDGFSQDKSTYPLVLKSCAKFSGIKEARQIHVAATKLGFLSDSYVQNALIHVYGLCNCYQDAGIMFDQMLVRDVVSWSCLIYVFVKGGLFGDALSLFSQMDVDPNITTLVSVLVACGRIGELSMGRSIHGLLLKNAAILGLIVGNALLDMYVKCESMEEARKVFEDLPVKDIVTWTSVISGLVQCKQPREALDVFHAMQASGMEPDKVVLSSVLSACASLGALDCGKWIHQYIEWKDIEQDVHIGTALVDLYAKCGCLEMALNVFHGMIYKNVLSWNALLGGIAMHGHGKVALSYFDWMVRTGLKPNDVTFIATLGACSHSGLVEEGRRLFASMVELYDVTPKIVHYGCMVDLLGRAGLVEEAYELVKTMPMRPDVLIWGAMLSACKTSGNVQLSQQIIGHLELEFSDSGVFVLLSNIYAANERWGDIPMLRSLMRKKGIKKEPGSSVIELDGRAHEFLVGEINYPQKEEILMILYILEKQMQIDGQ